LDILVRTNPIILQELQYSVKKPKDKFSKDKSRRAREFITQKGIGAIISRGEVDKVSGFLGGATSAFLMRMTREGILKKINHGLYEIISLPELDNRLMISEEGDRYS